MDRKQTTVLAIFAVLEAGGVFVIVHPTTKAAKLGYLLRDSGARGLIAQPQLASVVGPALDGYPTLEWLVWSQPATADTPRGATLDELIAQAPGAPRDPGLIDEDLCAIIYTSGSTGEPKGVMLTHRNMTNTAWSISTYLENVPDDVVLCVLPLSFDYGLYQVITGARVGFTVVLEQSFAFPLQTLQTLVAQRVTGLPGVPTIFATLLQMPAFAQADLTSLRYLSNTAAVFPPAHIQRLQALCPPQARIYSMYGLTECTRVSYLPPERLRDKITSVGKAMPNSEAYVVDEQGRRVGPGVVGELVIRGAHVMRGYWNKPEETARRLRPGTHVGEKVLYSGDLFRTDQEGFLYFVGRTDDIFKCKGEKIVPREIENVLYELEGVAEAVVFGMDDPLDGHAVKAVVVPAEGAALTEEEVRRHCRARLETYMVPKLVEFCTSLPKTESGKIRRAVVG